MAGLFNILKVTVSEDKICAHVLVNPGMPLMTSEDIEATARVYYLVPAIAKHLCLGDSGREFQDCMGQTELCHLLEHVTVELMNETGLAGSISCGRTRVSEHDERVFEVELSCPDDALAIGALSSATFMMDWAYLHADQPVPDVEGTVAGLRNLVLGMRAEAEGKDPREAVAAANGEDAAEDEGITVSSKEMKKYAEDSIGTSDYKTMATQYGVSKDQAKQIVRQSATLQKLYKKKVGDSSASMPTAPTEPADGNEETASKDYADYIIKLAGDEWDSEKGTWKDADSTYAKAFADDAFTADSATYKQAMTAYYTAYQQYSSQASSASSKWTEYANGLYAKANISIYGLFA